MQKTTKKTTRTEKEGAHDDDAEEKTEDMNEKDTGSTATKKVRFYALLTGTCFTSVFNLTILEAQMQ